MTLPILALILGLALLVWSADRFVEGAAATARHFGMPPLLIGMVIVGFGTSAPELAVSALASLQGNPGIALGNAYGSNISNIALILGVTALIRPISVHSQVLRKELPVLLVASLIAGAQLLDRDVSRLDAWVLLILFTGLMAWTIIQGLRSKGDPLGSEMESELVEHEMPLKKAILYLTLGLVLLVISSRILVWGAVFIAQSFGVSDLIIGLTIVAIGTSLPELAASIAATRKGEHDLALGNVLGSNLFNTLAVVGLAGAIHPMEVDPSVLTRDLGTMLGCTLLLLIMGLGRNGTGTIKRWEGGVLLAIYAGYASYIALSVLRAG